MSVLQINGMYPIEYFNSENNGYTANSNRTWWSSLDRYAKDGTEYIEIDLGRKRTINYISLDVTKKPLDITIEYDSVDLQSIDQYAGHYPSRWQSVKRLEGASFDSSISYESNSVNPWKHCEFFFTDANGDVLITQRIRISFVRRVEEWPVRGYQQFRWSVDAMNLRMGRYITEDAHAAGYLLEVPEFTNTRSFTENYEIRQRFLIPQQSLLIGRPSADLTGIDSFTPSDITPSLLGFEFMIKPKGLAVDVSFSWKLVDITSDGELVLDQGNVSKTTRSVSGEFEIAPSNLSNLILPEWVRITFGDLIQVSKDRQYELRIINNTPSTVDAFYVNSPNAIFDSITNTQYTDLYTTSGNTPVWRQNESLVYRVIADVGSAGKDLLGNEYREGVRYNSAKGAIDGKNYTNWTCFPNPSSEGVEALYFDVRSIGQGAVKSSVVDAIEVNCQTPGVMMNIYYSNQAMTTPPSSTEDWENVMWTPVRETYQLTQKQTIDFPYPVVANWICLEFYNLQPTIVSLPNYPILPEVEFKEFPDWAYSTNPLPKVTSADPYIQQEKFTGFKITDIMNPSIENPNGIRTYFDSAETLDQNYNSNGFGVADPRLLSQISFSRNMYSLPMPMNVDVNTSLGDHVYRRYTSDYTQTHITEAQSFPRVVNNRYVSSSGNRYEGARNSAAPISFNRVCAHQYAVRKARFNKKAYSVSISEVNFLKKDYTARWDDPIIHDLLVIDGQQDSAMIEYSEWMPEQAITMEVGAPIYVTYTVGNETYTDEPVSFEPFGTTQASYAPVPLAKAGQIATALIAHSNIGGQGRTYYRDRDFALVYDPGSGRNLIQRNAFPSRLVVPHIVNTRDQHMVAGSAIISAEIRDTIEIGNLNGTPLLTGKTTMNKPALHEKPRMRFMEAQSDGYALSLVWILTDL